MSPLDLGTLTAALPSPDPRKAGDDPAKAANQVFARILVQELQRSMPAGSLLGEGPFSALDTVVVDALASQLASADALGLGQLFAQPSGPAETGARHAPALVPGGYVTSGFGLRHDPFHGDARHHAGVDIAAPEGSPVRAARDGVVTRAEIADGYGLLVVVDHGDGIETRYAHCATTRARVGDRVRAGQPIATVGQSGRATGPHLHFEVRQDGQSRDPTPYLSGVRHPDAAGTEGSQPPADTLDDELWKLRLP